MWFVFAWWSHEWKKSTHRKWTPYNDVLTVPPKSFLDFQIHLEDHPDQPTQIAGFTLATHCDSTTLMGEADFKVHNVTSEITLHAIISGMYSSASTHWSPASLVGDLHPAGFLVPVWGRLKTDYVCLCYVIPVTFVGAKADYNPANLSHLVGGFSGQEVFSHGDDLDGAVLADGTLSVYSILYDDSLTAFSPTQHYRSILS